ncbi:MAG: hypothetical protein AAF568_04840, partial [Pseudomonadota bacterium]
MATPTLLIAMPTGGQVATPTVSALIGLTQHLQAGGIPFAFETYQFADIVMSRNHLMSRFLTDERFSHILCVDSDMDFEPCVVDRLLAFDAPFPAAAYAQKIDRWGAFRAACLAEAARPDAEQAGSDTLLARIGIYNHQVADFEGGPWR